MSMGLTCFGGFVHILSQLAMVFARVSLSRISSFPVSQTDMCGPRQRREREHALPPSRHDFRWKSPAAFPAPKLQETQDNIYLYYIYCKGKQLTERLIDQMLMACYMACGEVGSWACPRQCHLRSDQSCKKLSVSCASCTSLLHLHRADAYHAMLLVIRIIFIRVLNMSHNMSIPPSIGLNQGLVQQQLAGGKGQWLEDVAQAAKAAGRGASWCCDPAQAGSTRQAQRLAASFPCQSR